MKVGLVLGRRVDVRGSSRSLLNVHLLSGLFAACRRCFCFVFCMDLIESSAMYNMTGIIQLGLSYATTTSSFDL